MMAALCVRHRAGRRGEGDPTAGSDGLGDEPGDVGRGAVEHASAGHEGERVGQLPGRAGKPGVGDTGPPHTGLVVVRPCPAVAQSACSERTGKKWSPDTSWAVNPARV